MEQISTCSLGRTPRQRMHPKEAVTPWEACAGAGFWQDLQICGKEPTEQVVWQDISACVELDAHMPKSRATEEHRNNEQVDKAAKIEIA